MSSDRRGQSLLELALLLGAAVIAASLMVGYVRGAIAANVKLTELQLNGSMRDNRP